MSTSPSSPPAPLLRLPLVLHSAYIQLSISFIQMLKALMLVAIYSIFVLLKKDHFSTNTMANMVSISIGITPLLPTARPALTLGGSSLICLVFLFVSWILIEFPLLNQTSTFKLNFLVFSSNSVCAFTLNLAIFLLIGKTSALTMNVIGVVKDWLLIAFSQSATKDTMTPVNLVGYRIAMLGIAYYNHLKLQAMKAKEAQKKSVQADDEEASGLLLEEREGEAWGRKNKLQS